jgi:hypothetical protein
VTCVTDGDRPADPNFDGRIQETWVTESVYNNDRLDPGWINSSGEKPGNESLRANKRINACGILI